MESSNATGAVESVPTLGAATGAALRTSGVTPVVAVGWRGHGLAADMTGNTITDLRSGREDDVRQ